MSCMEYKTVLRAELPSLVGMDKTQAYNYFKSILGEAQDVEDYDGEIEWFEYEGQFRPVRDYRNKKWGIDLVLKHNSSYKEYIKEQYTNGVTLAEFKQLVNEMKEKFPEINDENVRLISYDWYNGGDEPIRL